jgi:hypothetical protein
MTLPPETTLVEPPDLDDEIDDETQSRIDAHLGLAPRFIDMIFADPSLLDAIPAEANVIFLPHDDPELAARHRAAGERMRAAGHLVHFVEV